MEEPNKTSGNNTDKLNMILILNHGRAEGSRIKLDENIMKMNNDLIHDSRIINTEVQSTILSEEENRAIRATQNPLVTWARQNLARLRNWLP